jgi:hypothetical protein
MKPLPRIVSPTRGILGVDIAISMLRLPTTQILFINATPPFRRENMAMSGQKAKLAVFSRSYFSALDADAPFNARCASPPPG